MPRFEYDRIGETYGTTRRPDPRIAAQIETALGAAVSVVNVGAGTGSYEPRDRRVLAVEPSSIMLRQRAPGSAPAVQALAEALPFPDRSFEAATAILTVHHWSDQRRGLAELRRVASRRVVVLTSDLRFLEWFWLTRDYFPAIAALDAERVMPLDELARGFGGATVVPVPIPHDCTDGFTRAFWRRPDAYLDPGIRAGMSTFALIDEAEREEGLHRLAADLASGAWAKRNGHLLDLDELDLGYRLVVAEAG